MSSSASSCVIARPLMAAVAISESGAVPLRIAKTKTLGAPLGAWPGNQLMSIMPSRRTGKLIIESSICLFGQRQRKKTRVGGNTSLLENRPKLFDSAMRRATGVRWTSVSPLPLHVMAPFHRHDVVAAESAFETKARERSTSQDWSTR